MQWSHRFALGLWASFAAVASPCAAAPLLGEPFPDTRFTIVVIPDTQLITTNTVWSQGFNDVTEWIADNVDHRNIVFVTHLGDITQGPLSAEVGGAPEVGFADQFRRADAAMDKLDGVVPYGAVTGNHDFFDTGNKCSSVELYKQYFGPSRYVGAPWYGGSRTDLQNDALSGISHYQIFTVGRHRFLNLSMEYKPQVTCVGGQPRDTDAVWKWAQSVLDRHPTLPTILSSHEYLTDTEEGPGGHRSGTGEFYWQRLVRRNRQIFMTLNGHEHEGPSREDGEHAQVSTNDAGLPVFEMLQNFQDWHHPAWGNDPYVRLIELDFAAGRIQVRTFNPAMSKLLAGAVTGDGGPRDDALAAADPGEPLALMPFQRDEDSEFGYDVAFDANGRPRLR